MSLGSRPFTVYGHRGTPHSAAENTLASFEQTVAAGCGFETDLRRLRDGTIVLFHDSRLAGVRVSNLTWTELSELNPGLVRLEELRRFSGQCPMILEIKESGWEREVLAITREWRDVVVSSFDLSVLISLKAAGCEHPLGLIAEEDVPAAATAAMEIEAAFCFPHYHHVTEELVAGLHQARIEVVPWSPNSPTIWIDLMASGCDGLITDLPALAMQWLKTLV